MFLYPSLEDPSSTLSKLNLIYAYTYFNIKNVVFSQSLSSSNMLNFHYSELNYLYSYFKKYYHSLVFLS